MVIYSPLKFTNTNFPKYHGESISLERVYELKDLYLSDIPGDLFETLEAFAKRNIIHTSKKVTRKSIKNGKICLRCLKAFIVDKSKELNISKEALKSLLLLFQCGTGHQNYYLDKKKAISIS